MTELVSSKDDLNDLIHELESAAMSAGHPQGSTGEMVRARAELREAIDGLFAQLERSRAETKAPLSAVPDDPVRKALAELVRLKDIKERYDALPSGVIPESRHAEYDRAEGAYFGDYKKNRDAAWAAARSALKSEGNPT